MIKDAMIGKINVYLKDGDAYLNKDIPQQPFGDNDKYVAFWDNDKLKVFPFEMVACIELFEDENE